MSGHGLVPAQMLAMCNGRERTLEEWKSLLDAGGWRIKRVHPLRTLASLVEAVPVEPAAQG